jgi:predicted nucleic acid-binding protein
MGPFFDTNVLVYFVDEDEPDKNEVACELVEEYLIRGAGMLSVQVSRAIVIMSGPGMSCSHNARSSREHHQR